MSRRALVWTAAVVLLLAALAVVFAAIGWPWRMYAISLPCVLVTAWVAYVQHDMAGCHAVGEDDWEAHVIAQMERDFAGGDTDEDAALWPAGPDEPFEPTPSGHLGVLGRMVERIRQVDWGDDRSTTVGWFRRSDSA